MIVDGHTQRALCLVLSNYILIEVFFDFDGRRKLFATFFARCTIDISDRFWRTSKFFLYDIIRLFGAMVTNMTI